MSDEVGSTDDRQEIDSSGTTIFEGHETRASLEQNLADWFRVDGAAVATVGSSGNNRSADHKAAKKGKVLVPLAPRVSVCTGSGLLHVAAKEVATAQSEVQVPDVKKPRKSGVLKVEQSFFRVDGQLVARGKS